MLLGEHHVLEEKAFKDVGTYRFLFQVMQMERDSWNVTQELSRQEHQLK